MEYAVDNVYFNDLFLKHEHAAIGVYFWQGYHPTAAVAVLAPACVRQQTTRRINVCSHLNIIAGDEIKRVNVCFNLCCPVI